MSTRRSLTEITKDTEFFGRVAGLAMRVTGDLDGSEVSAVLAEMNSCCGTDAAAFASFIKDDETYESYRFILACDPTWCLEYEGTASYMNDPWLEYTRHHSEPILTERVVARTGREKEVVALAKRFGFTSAVVVPTHSPQGLTRLGALCLGSEEPDYFDDRTLAAVSFAATGLAARLHTWQIEKLREELLARVQFSEFELSLLSHERKGLRSKEVAVLTRSTWELVDMRWQRLNAKLGVSSRAAAARIAAEYGLVD